MAHHLKPVIMIGKNGLTAALLDAVNKALDDHELIKIKFIDFKDEKGDIIREITHTTASEQIAVIGNIAIIFRQNKNAEKRRIVV